MENLTDKKILVIVDSYLKMQTLTSIFHFLNLNNINVISTGGQIVHIGDSKESYCNSGIYPDENFRVDWEIISSRRGIVMDLQNQVAKVDLVYIFTDPTLEGIQFAWTLVTFLNISDKYKWAALQTITVESVLLYLKEASLLDSLQVDAAQTKLIINKLLGYTLNPILKTYLGTTRISHSQILLLDALTKREQEIIDFKGPESYFTLKLNIIEQNKLYTANYKSSLKDLIKFKSTIIRLKENCSQTYKISAKEIKVETEPLSLIKLLKLCEERLQLPASTVLKCLTQLYEGVNLQNQFTSLISYPEITPIKCNKIQETSEELQSLISNKQLWKIYNLIWEYNYKPELFTKVKYIITNNGVNFELEVLDSEVKFNLDDSLNNIQLKDSQEWTTPVKRYTETTLLETLVTNGLDISALNLDSILDKKQAYCTKVKDQLVLTATGLQLGKYLQQHLAVLAGFAYNKKLENQFLELQEKSIDKLKVLQDFFMILKLSLESIKDKQVYTDTPICPDCGIPLIRRQSRYGVFFYGCPNWPNCKYTKAIK